MSTSEPKRSVAAKAEPEAEPAEAEPQAELPQRSRDRDFDIIDACVKWPVVFYRIKTQHKSDTPQASSEVFRRYSDFVWLREALQLAAPGAIVPPLPPVAGGTGNTDPAFIEERKAGLLRFLVKVGGKTVVNTVAFSAIIA